MPRLSAIRSDSRTSRPCTSTAPAVGSIMRFTVRSSVVFPEPLRPKMAVTVPSSRDRETWLSSRRPWGMRTSTSRNSIAGGIRRLVKPVYEGSLAIEGIILDPVEAARGELEFRVVQQAQLDGGLLPVDRSVQHEPVWRRVSECETCLPVLVLAIGQRQRIGVGIYLCAIDGAGLVHALHLCCFRKIENNAPPLLSFGH